ncbi:MAG: hypothetical protein MK105_02180 [Crocinitomicaceae bacterium]|nr:hypothetical protein [Crocinitomicaceae bacterium]
MQRLLITFLIICSFHLYAQDYHHWSEHFGARASLLGGAATAGLGDNSTTFYNAAAMSFVEDPSLSISVNAYRVRNLKMKNFLGEGLDLKSTQLSTMPNLISGIAELKKKPKLKLGYTVITRRNFNSKFDYLYQANYDILATTAGKEIFVAGYNFQHQLNEYWAGPSISYQLSKSFSIGLAHFGIYRDVKYSNAHTMSVLPEDGSTGDVASVATNVTFSYWNVKGVFKPSIALSLENFKFGMALTTPSFNMFGRAKVYRDYSIINLDELIGTDVTLIDRTEDEKVTHKENGSLAIGSSWKLGRRAWIHFTHETFFGGKYYNLFDPEQSPNVYPATIDDSTIFSYFGSQNFLAYGEETEARTNFGLGLELVIAKRWELYLGARTDFLYNEQPYYTFQTIGVESSKWDLYHFSLGVVNYNKNNKRYTVGVEYALTPKRKFYNVIDYTKPRVDNGLAGDPGLNAYAEQFSFKLLFEIIIGSKSEI